MPVEVPHPNYLPDKKLTGKELRNAWQAFEYTAAARQLAPKAARQLAPKTARQLAPKDAMTPSYHSGNQHSASHGAHSQGSHHGSYYVEPDPFHSHKVMLDHPPASLPHHPVPVPAPPIHSIHPIDQPMVHHSAHPLQPKHPQVIYHDTHLKVTNQEVHLKDADLKIKNQRRDTEEDEDAEYSKDSSFKDSIYTDEAYRENGTPREATREATGEAPYRDHVYRDRRANVYRERTKNSHKDSSMSKIKRRNSPKRRASKRNYDYD